MITALGLWKDGCKAIYRNIETPVPVWNERRQRYENIVLSEELYKEWEEKYPGEIVDVEDITDDFATTGDFLLQGWHGCVFLRLTRSNGEVLIEPGWKVFPLHPENHRLKRNTILVYTGNSREMLLRDVQTNKEFREHPYEGFHSIQLGCPSPWALNPCLARKLDITDGQAGMRSAGWTADDWLEELGLENIDPVFDWMRTD